MPQISSYTAATDVTADDVFVMNDGSTTKKVTAAVAKTYFAAGTGSVTYVTGLVAGDVGTNAAANVTALQAALQACEDAGGGNVVIPAGIYQVNATITIGSRVTLSGSGWGTRLKLANGSSTTATPIAIIAAEGNTNYSGLCDIYIDGNSANQVDTTFFSRGVEFYRGTTEGSTAPTYDGGMFIHRVMVYDCKGPGFYLRGDATTMRVSDCYAYHNHSEGFWLKTDCEIHNCVAANNGGEGIRVYSSTSARITSCKGFGNGWRYGASEFLIHYTESLMMSDCQAEDSRWRGFVFTACRYVSATNCIAYRATPETAESSAFWIEDDTAGNLIEYFYLEGVVRASGGGGSFAWMLTTRALGAQVEIRLRGNEQATGRWRDLGGSTNAKVTFGNEDGGKQAIAYAASITPDHYKGNHVTVGALTGNITVNNPVDPMTGQKLNLAFLQDATGGRTITWGSAFVTNGWTVTSAANGRGVIAFVYDGSKWVAEAKTEETVVTANTGTSYAINLANGNVFDLTVTGNVTFSFAGWTAGVPCSITVILRRDATGTRTITWPAAVKWIGVNPAYGTTASEIAGVVTLTSVDNGTTVLGFWGGAEQ